MTVVTLYAMEPTIPGGTIRNATVRIKRSPTLGIVTAWIPEIPRAPHPIQKQDNERQKDKDCDDIQQGKADRCEQLKGRTDPLVLRGDLADMHAETGNQPIEHEFEETDD